MEETEMGKGETSSGKSPMESDGGSLEEVGRWWGECRPHIRMLRSALVSRTAARDVEGPLQGCVTLYMANIQHPTLTDENTVLAALSGSWATPLEASFMWLGGWRPTSALLLVYSLMGVQVENEILNFKNGVQKGVGRPAAVLSEKQLVRMQILQKHTRQTELKLSKRLAVVQMLVSDQDVHQAVMLDLSASRTDEMLELRQVFKPRISRIRKLLIQAEQLRLRTLQQLFMVLSSVQLAHCGVAAFELAFMLYALGNAPPEKRAISSSHCIIQLPPSGLCHPGAGLRQSIEVGNEPVGEQHKGVDDQLQKVTAISSGSFTASSALAVASTSSSSPESADKSLKACEL